MADHDVARLFDLRTAPARDLAHQPGTVAGACHAMAWRFHQGGKLVVFGIGPASTDAVSIPISQLGQRLAELPDATEIVAYCRGPYCVFAHDAVRLLRAHGRATRRLAVGMPEWRLAGLPVAAGAAVRPART